MQHRWFGFNRLLFQYGEYPHYNEIDRPQDNDWVNQPMDPRIADPLGYRDDDDTRVTLDDDEMDECNGHLEVVDGWPKEDLHLGQIGGVAVCKDGHPVVFHRSQRVFDEK